MTIAHYPQATHPAPPSQINRLHGLAAQAILLAMMLSGCASPGDNKPTGRSQSFGVGDGHYAEPTALSARSNEVLMRAIGLVGTPYRYGGNTPAGGFDCSGLVDFVFWDAAGLKLPRSTTELVDLRAPRVGRDNLQAGDLLFFNPGGGKVSHIGIYVGEGRFVHAPRAGGTVRLDHLASDYWTRSFMQAKRVLR